MLMLSTLISDTVLKKCRLCWILTTIISNFKIKFQVPESPQHTVPRAITGVVITSSRQSQRRYELCYLCFIFIFRTRVSVFIRNSVHYGNKKLCWSLHHRFENISYHYHWRLMWYLYMYIYIYTTVLPLSCTDGRYFLAYFGYNTFFGTNSHLFGATVIFLLMITELAYNNNSNATVFIKFLLVLLRCSSASAAAAFAVATAGSSNPRDLPNTPQIGGRFSIAPGVDSGRRPSFKDRPTRQESIIISTAATMRVLNVLRHWVSKHSQVDVYK